MRLKFPLILAIALLAALAAALLGSGHRNSADPQVSMRRESRSASGRSQGGVENDLAPVSSNAAPERTAPSGDPADAGLREPLEGDLPEGGTMIAPVRVRNLDKAKAHVDKMPQGDALEQARAANVLLIASITTILDSRGDFVLRLDGEAVNGSPPPGYHTIASGQRVYKFSQDDFPEFTEVTRVWRGKASRAALSEGEGEGLDIQLHDQIWLRFQEARGIAWSMAD